MEIVNDKPPQQEQNACRTCGRPASKGAALCDECLANSNLYKAREHLHDDHVEPVLRILRQVCDVDPRLTYQRSQAYYYRGLIYSRIGKKRNALVAWEKALLIDPDNNLAKRKLVDLARKTPRRKRDELERRLLKEYEADVRFAKKKWYLPTLLIPGWLIRFYHRFQMALAVFLLFFLIGTLGTYYLFSPPPEKVEEDIAEELEEEQWEDYQRSKLESALVKESADYIFSITQINVYVACKPFVYLNALPAEAPNEHDFSMATAAACFLNGLPAEPENDFYVASAPVEFNL